MIYSAGYSLAIILVMAAMTFLTRAFPFLFFSKGRQVPQVIAYLGNVLPPAVMGMLIVYSLRGTDVLAYPYGLPELMAVAATVLLHLWQRNNLISILGGTAVYMTALQVIFA